MPYVYGAQESVHASEVDYVIDGGDAPLPELGEPAAPPTSTARSRALIAAEIEDGACLQIGIGGMPNAVCALLKDAGVRDLGIHTEMLVDGMIDLVEAGLVTGARKTIDRYQIVFTFAAGSRRQYDFIDRNPRVQRRPGRLHEPAAQHHAERPRRLDQQHDADRPAGPGGVGVGRPPPPHRHRRPAAVRARRLRLARRQVVHLPRRRPTSKRGARAEPHRARRSRPATSSPRRAPT